MEISIPILENPLPKGMREKENSRLSEVLKENGLCLEEMIEEPTAQQLLEILYLCCTLLYTLEEDQAGVIKEAERKLIEGLYDGNWRLRRLVRVEVE